MFDRPSYHNGFAPRDFTPRYPGLWTGCVGAWAPLLGPTGGTLRDWSAYQNHGTLTTMDPNTDWVISQGGYALDFDATDDHVTVGNFSSTIFASDCTLSAWIYPTDLSTDRMIFDKRVAGTDGLRFAITSTGAATPASLFVTFDAASVDSGANSVAVNAWQHVAVTRQGSSVVLFVNGIQLGSGTTANDASSTNAAFIGRRSFGVANAVLSGQIDDIRIYNRALNPNEVKLLALRRGIAYERRPRVVLSPADAAVFPELYAAQAFQQRGRFVSVSYQ